MNFQLTIPDELNRNQVSVRVAGTKDEPLFCLADVCQVLEIGDPSAVASRLDDDEKHLVNTPSQSRGNPNIWFITEAGLYTVLLRSDKPQAKPFRKWVTGEVLPTIRRHGCYPAPETDGKVVPVGLDGASPQAQLLVLMANHIAEQEAKTSRRFAENDDRWSEQRAWNGRVEAALSRPLPVVKNVDEGGESWISVEEYLAESGLNGVNAMSLGVRAGQALRRRGMKPQRIRSRNYYPRSVLEEAIRGMPL